MGKGRFLNQKLGKRTSRRLGLLKSAFPAKRSGQVLRHGKTKPTSGSPSTAGRDAKA